MQITFLVTNKALSTTSEYAVAVEDKVIIGRHLGSLVPLQGDRLSRHHFSLAVVDGALLIEDMSSNGTWLNGSLLKGHKTAEVKAGDIISIPGYEMIAELPKPASSLSSTGGNAELSEVSSTNGLGKFSGATHRVIDGPEVMLLFAAAASFAIIWVFLNR
jgi:predicted component of type VI protein secretion system